MKKIFTIFLGIAMLVTMMVLLPSCSSKENENNFVGTWEVDCIEYEGSKFTISEWYNIENEDFSNFFVILKDGGKAYIYDGDYGDLVNWLKTDDSMMIDDEKCSIVEDKICLDYYGNKIYLKKTSDNQEIPKEDTEEENVEDDTEEDAEEDTEEETKEDETTTSTTSLQTMSASTEIGKDFKEAMDSYEKFFDEYVAIMKKYKSNPTDLSILSDYSKYMSQYAEMMEDLEKWEDEEMNTAETAYYLQVQSRITQKLLEVAQ